MRHSISRILVLLSVGLAAATAASPAAAQQLPPQIHTVAGHGSCSGATTSGGPCDGVPAKTTTIGQANSVSPLPGGGYLFVDTAADLVREVSPTGTVTTVAGNGSTADSPDGTVATGSGLDDPVAVAALPQGGFLVTEFQGAVVRLVSPGDPGTATIATIAGTGAQGFNGDSGSATSLELQYPTDAELTPGGQVLIADSHNNRVRELSSASAGASMTTVAGAGACDDTTSACDGRPAGAVALHDPWAISVPASGGFLVAENDPSGANAVRRVGPDGTFTTVAGVPGVSGAFGGDGGPAMAARLDAPQGVTSLADGSLLIADTGNNRIREVGPTGIITTIAGTGAPTLAGDGGAATAASLQGPTQAVAYPVGAGEFLIADALNGVIREVTIAPVTTITLPSNAGLNGWFRFPVTASVTGSEGAKSSCVVDPGVPPSVFGQIPSGCPLNTGATITGDGVHTLWAASVNSFGDGEDPISAIVRIDTGAPTITCQGPAPSFSLDSGRHAIRAAVTDAVSGPAQPVVSVLVASTRAGDGLATLHGQNVAGTDGYAYCPYTVRPKVMRPTPSFDWAVLSGRLYATVPRLEVAGVPADGSVGLTCAGSGCPFAHRLIAVGRGCRRGACPVVRPRRGRRPRLVDLTSLIGSARLDARARLGVTVTEPNAIGRSWQLTLHAGRPPGITHACLITGSLTRHGPCTVSPPHL